MSESAPSPVPVAVGEVFAGKYRIERVLGEGGMGVVVAATHIDLHERVALKFLLPNAVYQADIVARFLREAQAAVRIKSEHVARVIDVGRTPAGSPYIVMEYLAGADLGAIVAEQGPLSIEVAADYLLQACEAVAEAHAIGIVHRDLKPSNLFVTERRDGSKLVKVLDFGLATAFREVAGETESVRLTSAAAVLGSPGYMSPEQIRDARKVDVRTDVWALGVIFYELVTGQLPFRADTAAGMLAAISADRHDPLERHMPEVPTGLGALVDGCLQKDPARRFHTVAEVARALVGFAPASAQLSVQRVTALLEPALASSDTVPGPTSLGPPAAPGVSAPSGDRSFADDTQVADSLPRDFSSRTVAGWEQDSSPGKRRRRALVIGGTSTAAAAIVLAAVMLLRGPATGAPAAADRAPASGAPQPTVEPTMRASEPAGAIVSPVSVSPASAEPAPSVSTAPSAGASARSPARATGPLVTGVPAPAGGAPKPPSAGNPAAPVAPLPPSPTTPAKSNVESATDSRR